MIVRLFFFSIVLAVAIVGPTWLLAMCALAYALKYTAYELIFIAAALDAYYGVGSMNIPYYTIITCFTLIFIEWLKPRLSVYN